MRIIAGLITVSLFFCPAWAKLSCQVEQEDPLIVTCPGEAYYAPLKVKFVLAGVLPDIGTRGQVCSIDSDSRGKEWIVEYTDAKGKKKRTKLPLKKLILVQEK